MNTPVPHRSNNTVTEIPSMTVAAPERVIPGGRTRRSSEIPRQGAWLSRCQVVVPEDDLLKRGWTLREAFPLHDRPGWLSRRPRRECGRWPLESPWSSERSAATACELAPPLLWGRCGVRHVGVRNDTGPECGTHAAFGDEACLRPCRPPCTATKSRRRPESPAVCHLASPDAMPGPTLAHRVMLTPPPDSSWGSQRRTGGQGPARQTATSRTRSAHHGSPSPLRSTTRLHHHRLRSLMVVTGTPAA